MKEHFKKIIYYATRFLLRLFTPGYKVEQNSRLNDSTVYIVKHRNLQGPLTVLAWFPQPLLLWAFHVFLNKKDCYRQYLDYTFTERLGMPRILAALVGLPLSLLVSGLMHLIQAIPVYRDRRAVITFKQSLAALTSGQSLLICPDINYTDTSPNIGEIYTGFLYLDKIYYKKTGQHLSFVPLYVNSEKRHICIGQAISFSTDDFSREKFSIVKQLKEEFARLELRKC